MNITGYKRKRKSIRSLLDREVEKRKPHPMKVRRLEIALKDCLMRIRDLKSKKKPKLKRGGK